MKELSFCSQGSGVLHDERKICTQLTQLFQFVIVLHVITSKLTNVWQYRARVSHRGCAMNRVYYVYLDRTLNNGVKYY